MARRAYTSARSGVQRKKVLGSQDGHDPAAAGAAARFREADHLALVLAHLRARRDRRAREQAPPGEPAGAHQEGVVNPAPLLHARMITLRA
jgi:hypothetical protein